MALELVAGALIGTALSELHGAIKDARSKISSFEPVLKRLESTLAAISPRLHEITLLSNKLHHHHSKHHQHQSGIADLVILARDGKELVAKCSKLSRLNYRKRVTYSKMLHDLDCSLLRYFDTVLQLDQLKDTKQILLVLNELHCKLFPLDNDNDNDDKSRLIDDEIRSLSNLGAASWGRGGAEELENEELLDEFFTVSSSLRKEEDRAECSSSSLERDNQVDDILKRVPEVAKEYWPEYTRPAKQLQFSEFENDDLDEFTVNNNLHVEEVRGEDSWCSFEREYPVQLLESENEELDEFTTNNSLHVEEEGFRETNWPRYILNCRNRHDRGESSFSSLLERFKQLQLSKSENEELDEFAMYDSSNMESEKDNLDEFVIYKQPPPYQSPPFTYVHPPSPLTYGLPQPSLSPPPPSGQPSPFRLSPLSHPPTSLSPPPTYGQPSPFRPSPLSQPPPEYTRPAKQFNFSESESENEELDEFTKNNSLRMEGDWAEYSFSSPERDNQVDDILKRVPEVRKEYWAQYTRPAKQLRFSESESENEELDEFTMNYSSNMEEEDRAEYSFSSLERDNQVDDILKRLLEVSNATPVKQVLLSESEIRWLCSTASAIFLQQPNLLQLEAPMKICGDIHGQYGDLLTLFEYGGFPPLSNYLFLGNYVDRGNQSLETICLLLCFKIKYPDNFFLLRGNHECASINQIYGFYDECKRRFNVSLWKTFIDCFNCLPVAALINDRILCVHGDLYPDLTVLDQIKIPGRPMSQMLNCSRFYFGLILVMMLKAGE